MSQQDWFKDDAADKKFEQLPEGFYSAALSNVTLDETKPEARLSLEFTLATKRKVWMNLKFTETQKKFLLWQMRELGVYDRAKEIAAQGKPVQHAFLDALGEVIGIVCELEITYREWQGKQYQSCRVDSVGGEVKPAVSEPAVKAQAKIAPVNHAPNASVAPPQMNSNEEIPDFMR